MSDRTIFKNALIFDGRTPDLLDGYHVVVEGGQIAEIGPGEPRLAADHVVDLRGRMLMPGMIDLHTHACLVDVHTPTAVQVQPELSTIHTAKVLRQFLDSGFTCIRDAGGMDSIFPHAMARGLLEGPRLYNAGRTISMTGGHGDMRDPLRPASAIGCCVPSDSRFTCVVDGVDQVRKAVRAELQRGAKHVKMFLSGGIMSPRGNVDALQFTAAEIAVAVEETRAQGTYVMAHCHPDNAIRRAVELGVRSIEHCSFVTEATARLMAERNAFAVPTLAVGQALSEDGERFGLSPANKEKLHAAFAAAKSSVGLLRRYGVKIGFGTDVSGQFQTRQYTEFELRADLMPAFEILVSATSVGAELLGEEGRLGVVAPGALADLIVVDGNPLDDIRLFDGTGSRIPAVMKEGRFVKWML